MLAGSVGLNPPTYSGLIDVIPERQQWPTTRLMLP
jgi:hypothetical protein